MVPGMARWHAQACQVVGSTCSDPSGEWLMRRISEPYECENGSALEELDWFHPLAFTLTLLALTQGL